MRLLAVLKPEDVNPQAPSFDYAAFKPRTACRAIVLDGDKVALIHIRKHDYYMLPGGGIEHEDLRGGLAREILEELGCSITITGELGSIETYFDRWQQKQTDYCYIARKTEDSNSIAPTGFEIAEEHTVIWGPSLDEAIKLVKEATPQSHDGKLVRARDLSFLQTFLANR